MRYLFALLCLAGLTGFYGCSNAPEPTEEKKPEMDSVENADEAAIPQMDILFPELHQFLLSEDSSFSIDDFEGGETEIMNDSLDKTIADDELTPFLPYLIFNKDSSYAIDMVSYNYIPTKRKGSVQLAEGGPDFEVGLINVKNKTRKRLLFFGTMGTVLDARWQDSTVIIAGANEIVYGDSLRPVIWKFEPSSGSWSVYTYKKMIAADWSDFPKPWLKKNNQNQPRLLKINSITTGISNMRETAT